MTWHHTVPKNTQYLFNLNVLNVTSITPIAKPITKPPDKSELTPKTVSDSLTCVSQ